ncbi:folate-binding protein YgfZ [Caulobacter sp. BE264]|uniref:CAF17-like 4Fe-4S cluster assembly/insertion protein YgfZ n=1 Tax=Caulobacter sp. BE264 TaxID=2817724 RepID=UPI00285D9FE9|nr:folate-binding protein YgfZ [Caulobacter sp. BE264]MDR7231386.1 folate-binding protein YgfZ [Caulobacter sp. BE264]
MTAPRLARLASRAVIAVSGPDWRSFLQGLLTQDVETLAAGELRFAGLLTPQGKLLYDLFVAGTEDGALLDVAAAHRDAILTRLTMYRLRAKVDLTAIDRPVIAVFGGEAPGGGLYADPRLPALGARAYDDRTTDADEDAYEAYRLALGAPGPADWGSETTYPIEANFDLLAGIDFKKGCFVGQETTSRMKRRGTIKNRMLPITFEGPPPPFGAEVLAGELRAGEVLSGRDGRAMALLRLDRIEGAALSVEGRPVQVERPEWLA